VGSLTQEQKDNFWRDDVIVIENAVTSFFEQQEGADQG
jgi:hypothetical protein